MSFFYKCYSKGYYDSSEELAWISRSSSAAHLLSCSSTGWTLVDMTAASRWSLNRDICGISFYDEEESRSAMNYCTSACGSCSAWLVESIGFCFDTFGFAVGFSGLQKNYIGSSSVSIDSTLAPLVYVLESSLNKSFTAFYYCFDLSSASAWSFAPNCEKNPPIIYSK